jgi:hypothetical protein
MWKGGIRKLKKVQEVSPEELREYERVSNIIQHHKVDLCSRRSVDRVRLLPNRFFRRHRLLFSIQ